MKKIYIKINLYVLFILFFSLSVSAQNGRELWTKTTKESLSKTQKVIRKTEPIKSTFYKLDINGLKRILQNAPKRKEFTGVSNIIVSFPNADGSLETYRILEASVMHPTLQAKHPNIRSYVGQSIDNPSIIIRFSITPQGLHTMTLSSNKGTQFIDPYTKDSKSYIVYKKRDLPALDETFVCGFTDETDYSERTDNGFVAARNANDGILRTFELALGCSIEYTDFHGGAVNDALTAMGITITRVSGIYERDLSVKLQLIANNNLLISTTGNSLFSNNPSLSSITPDINAIVNVSDYHIGHVFTTGSGGSAFLGIVCTADKGAGTTGLSNPVGDTFDVDYVAHEMGHQFGAPHTWNGDTGNCTVGQRTASNAYEPGSGSTIMAYAGICSPQNVQSNSDAYFHQKSLEMIWANITTGNSQCGAQTPNGNAAPNAMAGTDYTIPISTPYKLTGSSTDTETTSTHTFTWEQWDLGPSGIPTETTATGPLVRTFEGTTDPVRYIPRLSDLLNSGGGSTTWEKLVSISRAINYQLTVRDNGMSSGQTDSDGMIVTTDVAAGPFTVTSQATSGISWPVGSTQTVTWNKANTDIGLVNTPTVNIKLSIDAGLTFPITLASGVPNNGSYEISSVPNNIGPYCRIMVEGVNNIFFNINTVDFAVGYTVTNTCTTYNSTDVNLPITITDNGQSFTETSGLNIPASVTITDVNFTVDITHTWPGDLLLGLESPNNTLINIMEPYDPCQDEDEDVITTFDDDGIAFACNTTGDGLTMQSPISLLSGWNGEDASGVWVLRVGDFGALDEGTLNGWSVEICYDMLTPLGTDEFDLINFSFYPNPNNGEFTVKLNSNSGNAITINVFDIRGRRVFDKIYNNTSNFNEVIKLGNVQSGIYLLNVNDGIRSTTKKIIVN